MLSRETKDIAIAWLVLSVAFSLIFSGLNLFGIMGGGLAEKLVLFLIMLPVSLFVVGTAFVFHELGHRNVARHFNYFAEFRKWDYGLKIALFFAFVIGVIFAAPGAVYIGGKKKSTWEEKSRWDAEYPEYSATNTKNEFGLIAVAGVVINIVLGLFFFGLLYFVVPLLNSFQFILPLIFGLGYQINFILAGFNLIPFGPLDGKKVMEWNPIIWAVLFFPLLIWFFYL